MNHFTLNAISSQLNVPWASPYQPESDAIFAAMVPTPDIPRKQAIDDFVITLKNGGVFSLLDCFKVFASHSQQAGHVNWANPSVFAGSLMGGATWIADTHFKGASAEGSAIDTGFTPSTAVKMYKRHSEVGYNLTSIPTYPSGSTAKRLHMGVSSMLYSAGDGLEQHHGVTTDPWLIAYRRNDNKFRAAILSQYLASSGINQANHLGLYSVIQPNTTSLSDPDELPIVAYRSGNGSALINVMTAGDTVYAEPAIPVYLGAVNMPDISNPQGARFSSNAGFNLFYAGKELGPTKRGVIVSALATYLAAL